MRSCGVGERESRAKRINNAKSKNAIENTDKHMHKSTYKIKTQDPNLKSETQPHRQFVDTNSVIPDMSQ